MLWILPCWWVLSYDTLIWRPPLDSDLQKQGLASRSEFANLGAGGRRFKSGRPDHQHEPPAQQGCRRPSSGYWSTLPVASRSTTSSAWQLRDRHARRMQQLVHHAVAPARMEGHGLGVRVQMRPAQPRQHGTNQNTNGLQCQYLPNCTDLSRHSAGDLAAVAAADAHTPRPPNRPPDCATCRSSDGARST